MKKIRIMNILPFVMLFVSSMMYVTQKVQHQELKLIEEVETTGKIQDGKIKFFNITLGEYTVTADGKIPKEQQHITKKPYFHMVRVGFSLFVVLIGSVVALLLRTSFIQIVKDEAVEK